MLQLNCLLIPFQNAISKPINRVLGYFSAGLSPLAILDIASEISSGVAQFINGNVYHKIFS